QLDLISGLQAFVLLVRKGVGLIVLLADKLISIALHTPDELGSIMVSPVQQSANRRCATGNSSDDRAFVAVAAMRIVGWASWHSTATPSSRVLRNSQVAEADN